MNEVNDASGENTSQNETLLNPSDKNADSYKRFLPRANFIPSFSKMNYNIRNLMRRNNDPEVNFGQLILDQEQYSDSIPQQENPSSNLFYRKHMGVFLILLSLSPLVLSVFARFGPEDQKPEYLVGLIMLLCFLLLLQFLLFVSMILCPKGNKGAIAVLFAAGVCTMIGLILASIAKYRMDNDEEEEAITEPAIGLSCVTFILLAVFVGIFNIK